MKFEVDKLYRTRSGEMVKITSIDQAQMDFPIKGSYLIGKHWNHTSWTKEGNYSIVKTYDGPHDIICEWDDHLVDVKLDKDYLHKKVEEPKKETFSGRSG